MKDNRRFACALLCSFALFAGCATVSGSGLGAGDSPCMPPGIADVLSWSVWHAASGIAVTESGGVVEVLQVGYMQGDRRAVVVWARGVPIGYDAAPEDKEAPYLVNEQLVTGDGQVRDAPVGPCRWRSTAEQRARSISTNVVEK